MNAIAADSLGAHALRSRLRSNASAVVAMAVAACVVTVARRPDALFHAQFWAEDGRIFFQEAWNERSLDPLTTTYAGYLEELPRLVAIPAVALGLHRAPLLFNLVALAIQVAPAVFFVSDRCASLVRSRAMRAFLAGIYLLLPNAEINLTLSNAQWHLAVIAFLIVVATPARHLLTRIAECVVILLAVLTGPFGVLLVAIAAIWYWRRRLPSTRGFIAVAGIGTVIQLLAYALGPGRPHAALGASLERFIQIAANRVFLAGTFAQDQNPEVVITQLSSGALVRAIAIVVVGSAILGYAIWRGPLALKLFILFATVIFIGGLVAPMGGAVPEESAWLLVSVGPSGGRYFFMMEIAWLLALIWLLTRIRAKAIAAALLAIVCAVFASGVVSEWSYHKYFDLHPLVYVEALQRAQKGDLLRIPLNPVDPGNVAVVSYAAALEQVARQVALEHPTSRKRPRSVPQPSIGAWEMRLVAR